MMHPTGVEKRGSFYCYSVIILALAVQWEDVTVVHTSTIGQFRLF